jgi:hypothetical protein
MRFVFFIGHHKVGSSALQDMLSRNMLRLLKAGIHYPMVEAVGQAQLLRAALAGADRPEPLPINAREAHNALAFRMLAEVRGNPMPPYHRRIPASGQMLHAIRTQIELLGPAVTVLCAEVFANFGATDPALIDRLGRLAGEAPLTLLCTLRRPDDYLASWQGQRLKFGHAPTPLREAGVADYAGTIHFDYALMLRPWAERLPQARLVLRNYRDVLAAGGSVPDFFAQAGIAPPAGLVDVGTANPSIPHALMEIVRRANAALPGPAARALRLHLMERRAELDLVPNGAVELWGAAQRADLVARFAPVEAWLAARTGAAFFADLEAAREIRPVPELEAARAALAAVRALPPDPPRPLPKEAVIGPAAREFLAGLRLH